MVCGSVNRFEKGLPPVDQYERVTEVSRFVKGVDYVTHTLYIGIVFSMKYVSSKYSALHSEVGDYRDREWFFDGASIRKNVRFGDFEKRKI